MAFPRKQPNSYDADIELGGATGVAMSTGQETAGAAGNACVLCSVVLVRIKSANSTRFHTPIFLKMRESSLRTLCSLIRKRRAISRLG